MCEVIMQGKKTLIVLFLNNLQYPDPLWSVIYSVSPMILGTVSSLFSSPTSALAFPIFLVPVVTF